jgi:hypothetical protein
MAEERVPFVLRRIEIYELTSNEKANICENLKLFSIDIDEYIDFEQRFDSVFIKAVQDNEILQRLFIIRTIHKSFVDADCFVINDDCSYESIDIDYVKYRHYQNEKRIEAHVKILESVSELPDGNVKDSIIENLKNMREILCSVEREQTGREDGLCCNHFTRYEDYHEIRKLQ